MRRIALITIGGIVIFASSAVQAESESSADNEPKLQFHRRTIDDAVQLTPEEMLSDLRDVSLSLGQAKQQSVNLFLEATRKRLTPTDRPILHSPTSISESMLSKNDKYAAPRKEWLVFYVNTLEPIIHLMTDDIYDVDTNERKVSRAIEEKINPLWSSWKKDVKSMRESLDKIQELIAPDEGTNLAIAKEAIHIYTKADQIEKKRYRVYELFRDSYLADTRRKSRSP